MADKTVAVFVAALLIVVGAAYAIFSLRIFDPLLLILLGLAVVVLFSLSPRLVEFKEYERGVVFRFGKFSHVAGPGWVLLFPAFESFTPIDLRVRVLDTHPQEAETQDNVNVKIDAISYIRITDPKKVVLEVKNLEQALTNMLVGEIRNIVAKMPLEMLMEKTEDINTHLFSKLKEVEESWGFLVLKAEVVSIELPPDIMEARHKARAAKEYKTKLTTEAEARQVSIELLDQAASKMSDKTLSYLYLDALKKISEGKSNKIIFPLELSRLANLLSSKMGGKGEYEDVARQLVDAYAKQQKQLMDRQAGLGDEKEKES